MKETVVIRLTSSDGLVGYGEAPVFQTPSYSEECTDTVIPMLFRHMLPAILGRDLDPAGPSPATSGRSSWMAPSPSPSHHITTPLPSSSPVEARLSWIRGNSAAKCAVEAACWHIRSQEARAPLFTLWGGSRDRVEAGISLGIDDNERLLRAVGMAVDNGFKRLKIKIKPGSDIQRVDDIRKRFPAIQLSVDANGAYTLDDLSLLRQLDQFSLMMIEQPLAIDDLVDHARLHEHLATPICLDESIRTRADARKAIDTGAAQIINVKPSRLGGYNQALLTGADCLARDIPAWCGGMLETGIGKAFNVHLSSHPAFTLPGDISGTDRYFQRDVLAQPIVVDPDGFIAVPTAPGLGYDIDEEAINSLVIARWNLDPT